MKKASADAEAFLAFENVKKTMFAERLQMVEFCDIIFLIILKGVILWKILFNLYILVFTVEIQVY